MPITYFYFCALATLLFYIPDKPFLETARFELDFLWDKLKYIWVTKSREINKYLNFECVTKYELMSGCYSGKLYVKHNYKTIL